MIKFFNYCLCTALLLAMAVSCEKSVSPTSNMTLVAKMEGFQTKGSASGTWNGDEELAVMAAPEGVDEVRKYKATPSGELTSSSPFNISDEMSSLEMQVWYPYSESAGQWEVSRDQSEIEDLEASDFMYASSFHAVPGNNEAVLYHQMSRIRVNLIASAGVSADNIEGVTVGDGNIALKGAFSIPEAGQKYGVWTPDKAEGSVIPCKIETAEGASLSYMTVVIPQDVTGKDFIVVTLDGGKKLSYALPAGKSVLTAGYEYDITLTVNPDELVIEGGLSASTLKPGDYFYSDGTWSDGGLREVTEDGLVWAAEKPAPVSGKTVIGIVFCTDSDRIGKGEKEALAAMGVSEPHGLVLSTKAYDNNRYIKWFEIDGQWMRDEKEVGLTEIGDTLGGEEVYELIDADIEGYANNMIIRTKRADDLAAGYYPGFKAAMDFASQVGGPDASAKTTGWYIPSNGQLVDIFRYLLGCDLNGSNFVHEIGGIIYWQGIGNSPAKFNEIMSKVPAANKNEYPGYNNSLMACSQGGVETMRYIDFTESGYLDCMRDYKNRTVHIRCVLAF